MRRATEDGEGLSASEMTEVEALETGFEGPHQGFNSLFNLIRVDCAIPALRVVPD